ncbi:MAG: alcohol dehydrogenase catalytic domain-containing protein [Deltaproteobacteria bacterium]|nr:alcohol dehydrogenase catalytic domain-containing protein [Deltaproteobacteria bacterium]
MKTKAAVTRSWGEPMTIEELELESPKAGEVLIKVAHTGFCHSDLSAWKGIYGLDVLPIVLGHECAGVVQEVGAGVTHLKPGDHAVSCWQAPCGTCESCVSGNTHICENLLPSLGSGKLMDGTARFKDKNGEVINHALYVSGFSEYIVSPAIASVKVPKELPLDQACLLGCAVGTGWGAVHRSAMVKTGESVAVWGCGGIGLNIIQGARLAHAYPIIAVDLEGSKEALAREMGATHFINSSKEDPVPIIREKITGGKGVHYVFEAIGDPGAYLQSFFVLKNGGRLMAVGIPSCEEMVTLPFYIVPFQANKIEGVLYGSLRHQIDIPRLADLALRGDLKLEPMITQHCKLEDVNGMIEAMEKREIVGRWVFDF